MKINTVLSLCLVVLASCKPGVEVLDDKEGYMSLKISNMGLDRTEIVEWKLGRKKDPVISKGIRVALDLPELPTSLAKDLYAKGANAWVIKTVKTHFGGGDILDYGYIPFIIEAGGEDGKVSASKIRYHFLQISYSGVRIPKRFEEFNCPMYSHKKIVKSFSVKKNWDNSSVLSVRQGDREKGKLHKASLEPQVIDAGNSILGTYTFYIALINSKTKVKLSNYIPFEEQLVIESEVEGKLGEECLSFNPNANSAPRESSTSDDRRPFGL